MRKKLTTSFIADIIILAILWLIPGTAIPSLLRNFLLILLTAAAIVLLYLICRRKETEEHVQIISIDPVSQMNPAQYISKAGPVCAGSDSRYHVTFLLQNDLKLALSLSAKQAGSLSNNMRGTLVHNDNVFIAFTPDK